MTDTRSDGSTKHPRLEQLSLRRAHFDADDGAVIQIPAGSTEDKELTLAFKRGDERAYRVIYDRYHGRVEGVCKRMLGNREDAAEASQETFLRAYQALGRFNGRYQLGPWITRIATNVCLDHIRSRSRKPVDPVPSELFELELDHSAEQHGPEAIVIRDSESRHIRRVLASLPPMHRAAIVLRDFEGLSYEEVAIALGVTDVQVKALIHRARGNFKRSWSSSIVAAFLPIRNLVQRIKELGPATTEQVAAATTASSCVSATAAERICAAAAAVIFTGGIATGVVGHGSPARSSELNSSSKTTAPVAVSPLLAALKSDDGVAIHQRHSRRHDRMSHEARETGVTTDETATEPVAAPAPTPTPSPTSEPMTPEPSDGDSAGSEDPSAEPKPDPTPSTAPAEPDGFVLGFDSSWSPTTSCWCVTATKVESETVQVADTGVGSFSQKLSGTAKASGSDAYGLTIAQSGDSTTHRMDFGLRTDEGLYMYRATGQMVEAHTTEWGGWAYRYSGSYEMSSRSSSVERMPTNGTYSVEIFFSWRSTRITYANFVLD
jgi:RNA polymerase sigma-70 factor, ECF subfamily